ncbi:hypothetical protein FRC08_013942 [Ceratobasidium sp. 394]|nr:hypothetical protein FRC08_013942 [Ceratobasidium sp. 394]
MRSKCGPNHSPHDYVGNEDEELIPVCAAHHQPDHAFTLNNMGGPHQNDQSALKQMATATFIN